MEGKRLLRTLRLTNFLSYGPEAEEIELEPLNVLIGPNGSGKSNLIEAIGLLKAAPADVSIPIRAGGGVSEWAWKGSESSAETELEIQTTLSYSGGGTPLRYLLALTSRGQQVQVAREHITAESTSASHPAPSESFYSNEYGDATLSVRDHVSGGDLEGKIRTQQPLSPEDIDVRRSVLSQRRDPDHYPELTYLEQVLSEIELFRACNLGHDSPLRGPQRADLTSYFILEDGSNLGIMLNRLLNLPPTKKRLLLEMKRFCEHFEDITTRIVAGTVETSIHERGLRRATPSTRLSDGTLRYLSLLTILCDPEPPPLVCIEDPEIALHPDILPNLAELLLDASQRTQLVITTHSDILVSALSHVPEAIVVCERDDSGSHLKRLDAARLKEWLEKYSLGELWISGEIGGNP